MGYIMKNGIKYGALNESANNITYDNSGSGLMAANTQDAIDVLANEVEQNFGGLRFGQDGEGNYGYFKGDDTFIPFKVNSLVGMNVEMLQFTNVTTSAATTTFTAEEDGYYLVVGVAAGTAETANKYVTATTTGKEIFKWNKWFDSDNTNVYDVQSNAKACYNITSYYLKVGETVTTSQRSYSNATGYIIFYKVILPGNVVDPSNLVSLGAEYAVITVTADASNTKSWNNGSETRSGTCISFKSPEDIDPLYVIARTDGYDYYTYRLGDTMVLKHNNENVITNVSDFSFTKNLIELPTNTTTTREWEVIVIGKKLNERLGDCNLYKVGAEYVGQYSVTLDISFLDNYTKLTVDDIYLYNDHGVISGASLKNALMTYTYDANVGKITVTSDSIYFTEGNKKFTYLVSIKPQAVIKVKAKSINSTDFTITYDLSSYNGYKNLTGRELLWWMPYVVRLGNNTNYYIGRPCVYSYDAATGTLVIKDDFYSFPEELLDTETTFFIPSAKAVELQYQSVTLTISAAKQTSAGSKTWTFDELPEVSGISEISRSGDDAILLNEISISGNTVVCARAFNCSTDGSRSADYTITAFYINKN